VGECPPLPPVLNPALTSLCTHLPWQEPYNQCAGVNGFNVRPLLCSGTVGCPFEQCETLLGPALTLFAVVSGGFVWQARPSPGGQRDQSAGGPAAGGALR